MKKLLFTFGLVFALSQISFSQTFKLKANADSVHVIFHVTDFDSIPEQGSKVNILNPDQSVLVSGEADIDGNYEVLLPKGKEYGLVVYNRFGKSFEMGTILLPDAVNATLTQGLLISLVTKYLRVYKLDNVHFDTGKSDIKPESEPALKALAKEMKANPKMIVELAGHTDNVGDDDKNMRLSQSRANSAINYIVAQGISEKRLVAKGYGEKAPVADNNTPEGRQQNRRTEVKVIAE